MSRVHYVLLGLAALVAAGVLAVLFFPARGAAVEKVRLPAAALLAIREEFPRAVLTRASLDDEDGATVFVVEMKAGLKYVEVVVSPDGVIAEVSSEIKPAAAPEAVMAAIRKAAEGAEIVEVDRVSTRAEVRDGKLVKLPREKITYWAEFEKGNLGGEIDVAPDGTLLDVSTEVEARDVPEPAMAMIRRAAEGAPMKEIDREETYAEALGDALLYPAPPRATFWAAFDRGSLLGEITVAPDGTIVETSTELDVKDVPKAVMAAIVKAADGARIKAIGRDKTYAEVTRSKFLKLAEPDVTYWAEFEQDDLAGEVSVEPDGTVDEVLRWKMVSEGEDVGTK